MGGLSSECYVIFMGKSKRHSACYIHALISVAFTAEHVSYKSALAITSGRGDCTVTMISFNWQSYSPLVVTRCSMHRMMGSGFYDGLQDAQGAGKQEQIMSRPLHLYRP